MMRIAFAFPGDLDTPTGGYGYDRRIIAGMRQVGWQVDLVPLGEGFPFPDGATSSSAEASLAALPKGSLVVIDGLAFGAMPDEAARLSGRLQIVALVHHPLCRENGLPAVEAERLYESEAGALRHARHVIVTSPATAAQVRDLFDLPDTPVSTVLPGTDKPEAYERPEAERTRLLSVGTVVPRKGYDLLFEALADLQNTEGHEWHLDIVGGLEADPDCYTALNAQAEASGLSDRVTFHGALSPDQLEDFYKSAQVFVLASRYEGYGMAYTEALAHGLPVIGSGGGAVRDTLPEGAAIYCGAENVKALRDALHRLITKPEERSKLAAAAKAAAQSLPDWRDASAQFAEILMEIDK